MHCATIRKMNRIEQRLSRIEKHVENQLVDIDGKLKSIKETDPFDQFVELCKVLL